MWKAGIAFLLLWMQQDPKMDCPMSEVKNGLFCDTCRVILEDETIVDRGYCKKCCEGLNPKDRVRARTVEVCVRTYYVAACHPNVKTLAPGMHCDKSLEMKVSKACVLYRCVECAKTHEQAGVCCKQKTRAWCSFGGAFPHTIP